MPTVHKVVGVQNLVQMPPFWHLGVDKDNKFATGLEAALDKMASEGWELVSAYGGLGSGYFIFRRDEPGTKVSTK